MFCSRGIKRKSLDPEDQENHPLLNDENYVCMQRLTAKRHAFQGKPGDIMVLRSPGLNKLAALDMTPLNSPLPQCDDDYETYQERHGYKRTALRGRGQLHVAIYVNHGLLTIHVIRASHLSVGARSDEGCCAFVKVSLIPDHNKKTKCRTSVSARSSNPAFDEKFSFELLEEDLRKRILISVWARDRELDHNECLGCMSFGIQHILSEKKTVDGWYYLLSEDVGQRKHLQVATRARFMSPARNPDRYHHDTAPHHQRHTKHTRIPAPRIEPPTPHAPHPDYLDISPVRADYSPRHGPLGLCPVTERPTQWGCSTPVKERLPPRQSTPGKAEKEAVYISDREAIYTELTSTPLALRGQHDLVNLQPHVFVMKRGEGGYGFSVTGSGPVRVTRVDTDSPAESVGLQRDDLIVRLNATNVVKSNAEAVARIIKSSEKKIIIEIERLSRTLPPGQEDIPKYHDTHTPVNTPEYTPLIQPKVRKPRTCTSSNPDTRRQIRDPSPAPIRKDSKKDKHHGKKSVGMCAAFPIKKVHFYDDFT